MGEISAVNSNANALIPGGTRTRIGNPTFHPWSTLPIRLRGQATSLAAISSQRSWGREPPARAGYRASRATCSGSPSVATSDAFASAVPAAATRSRPSIIGSREFSGLMSVRHRS